MFVRVARGTADPARWDDLVALTEDFAAVFKQMPGFVSYQGGGDRRSGAFVSITTWETEKSAHFSRDSLGDALQRLLALGAQVYAAEIYEVVRAT